MLELVYERQFLKDLRKVPKELYKDVELRLETLAANAEEFPHVALTGSKYSGIYKLRISDWRVFYQLDWRGSQLVVLSISHRSKAYR